MPTLRKYLPLAAAALALLALAAGIGGLTLQPGRPLQLELPAAGAGGGSGGGFDIRLALVAFIWFCLIVSAVGLAVSRSLRRYLLRTLPIYIVYGLLLYLFFSWLWSQAGAGGGAEVQPPPLTEAGPTPPPLAAQPLDPPAFVANPPQWLVLGVSLAVGLAVVGAIWLIARRARRGKPEDALAQLAHQARSALTSLESGEELRNAVLRCYAEMSRVLGERRGVQRDKTMTPREFEARLAAVGVRDEHIRRLTRLFERVRYGGHEPGAREEREAVACLTAIVEAYGAASARNG